MKKLFALLLISLLTACGHPGSEYLGKWQTADGKRTIDISQNGESLLVKITEPTFKGQIFSMPGDSITTTFSGTIKDGLLKVGGPMGDVTVTHVKDNDTLLFPSVMGGNIEYKRSK